jgi:hypothetical protein
MAYSKLPRGTVLTVEGVYGRVLYARDSDGQGHSFQLAPAVGVHEDHPGPQLRDRLVVRLESAATGDTLVQAPCGCSILLLDGHAEDR